MNTDCFLRRVALLFVALSALLPSLSCTAASDPTPTKDVSARGNSLTIGPVVVSGADQAKLYPLPDHLGFTNGTDSFYPTKLTDGGVFILYRYAPPMPTITANPYPEVTLPGRTFRYVKPVATSPFFKEEAVAPPFSFETPYSQLKWPALLSDAGVGIFEVAESPIFEEAIEPFVSAYPAIRLVPDSGSTSRLRFDLPSSSPTAIELNWQVVEHAVGTTTYVASIPDPSVKAVAIHLPQPTTARRVWYRSGTTWSQAVTQHGGKDDPDLLIVRTDKPNLILIESVSGAPGQVATMYSSLPAYVDRARWAAFTIYQNQTVGRFFNHSMTPSFQAYNDRLYSLRDQGPVQPISSSWRNLLRLDAATSGKNLLNPKFFNVGFPAAGDPSFTVDPNLQKSVSWSGDQAALQASMGVRLFGLPLDPRYAQAVKAFYDPTTAFYYGAYDRASKKFTSADTGSNGVVIGYNYLLSLTLLTELIGTPTGLPANAVLKLVDRVLPLLSTGYTDGFPQVPYLWQYPQLTGLQWEYGMGKELSEAQLSSVCGLWWLRTHDSRFRDCEVNALRLPEAFALTFQGSSYLWGLDVVHGGYVVDALLLAYQTTGQRHYLDAALTGWREELLFLFSDLNYPETPFDDRGMAVTSFYSTFADLHQGNYWRGDAWNDSRTLWSLAKLLAYVDDPRIVNQLTISRETHKQSMPTGDAVYTPVQRSDYYNKPIDPNDFQLSYEDLANHYSTQVAYSSDVWREAFLYDSVTSPDADVFRIPGTTLSDAGFAYVVGKPGRTVHLTIVAHDCTFDDGGTKKSVLLDASGLARVQLRGR